MVMVGIVKVTAMFVEAPFSRNSTPHAEEPPSPLLASPSSMTPATTTLAATDEVSDPVDEEVLSPTETHYIDAGIQSGGVGRNRNCPASSGNRDVTDGGSTQRTTLTP